MSLALHSQLGDPYYPYVVSWRLCDVVRLPDPTGSLSRSELARFPLLEEMYGPCSQALIPLSAHFKLPQVVVLLVPRHLICAATVALLCRA